MFCKKNPVKFNSFPCNVLCKPLKDEMVRFFSANSYIITRFASCFVKLGLFFYLIPCLVTALLNFTLLN